MDLRSDEEIDPDMPLSDLGMDSLLAVELRNSLGGALNRHFASTILFDYPTLRDLLRYLEYGKETTTVVDVQKPTEMSNISISSSIRPDHSLNIVEAIEDMSDEEIDVLYQRGNHH
jgi:acyl carrier protein